MSDEPVLTSSYCTNWGAYNTPRVWAMVANEDDPDAWRQVAAWGDVALAMKDHKARLKMARDSLAAAWSPDQNESAAAFVKEFDILLAKMDEAKLDADTTASGLANILEELRQAKADIQPLYEEYKSKNSDLIPGWVDSAEDEIDEKARTRMMAAERVVEMHVAQIKVPAEYKMDPKEKSGYVPGPRTNPNGGVSTYGGSGAAGGSGGGGVGSPGSSLDVPHDPPPTMPGHDPILPDQVGGGVGGGVGAGVGSGVGGDTGPGLAGVGPTPPPVLPPGNPGVPPVIGPPGPPAPAPLPPIGMPGLPGGVGGGGGGGGTLPAKTMPAGLGGPGKPGGVRAGGMRGALPSGAVIGETIGGPGARGGAGGIGGVGGGAGGRAAGGVGGPGGRAAGGVGGPGGRAAGGVGGPGGRAAGAVGGVGGPGGRAAGGVGGPGGRAAGGPGARGTGKPIRPSWLPPDEPGAGGRPGANSAMTGASGRRGAGGEDEGEGKHFDPDNPWEVESGVTPVIRPRPQTGRHDPGPNVIGGYRG
ncbi:hypothetical protein AB0M20_01055 [Actinoplanes sp. NPDC051633]|uniref:WXG100 family type VII secretion target n=1 Tax=Actinoplanes sp. NPDC051633 TaxID=3155670 RepID=UPI00341205A9